MSSPPMSGPESVSKEPIAIIGAGCVLPDAPDVATFWSNLLAGKSSVTEVPKGRWDPALFWSADKSAPDKTYAKIGAFVSDDAFNPLDYRMPPTVLVQVDPSQRWALAATRQALRDAGLKTGLKGDDAGPDGKPLRDFDRNRCAVILGNAMGGELMKLHTKRLYWPQVEQALRADPAFAKIPADDQAALLGRAEAAFKGDVPPVTEDSMPGTLSNVAAGRIANVFDLAGKNFTTDAACASSLAALDAAMDCLRKDECDLVVWGGTDRSMDVTPYVEFSKIGALSADGSRPFDAGANGFVMGEGCAIFILKRLSDAERDGDRVYAVVRGIGGSSDGKGKGITAPNPAGQVKAVTRAYQDAEVDPTTIGYLEAHGTSTPVGDPVELQSVVEAFKHLTKSTVAPGSIAVGSVKSNMGHLKSAAGAAGLLKAALALKTGIIPPSIGVKTLNPRIDWATAPFKVATRQLDFQRPATHPRRAAVSSFGFGGTNFHVVLEEHIPGHLRRRSTGAHTLSRPDGASQPTVVTMSQKRLDTSAFQAAMQSRSSLESEAVVMDAAQAMQALGALQKPLTYVQTGEGARLRDLVQPITAKGLVAPTRVAFALASPDEAQKKLEQAQKAATNPAQARLAFQQGVFLNQGKPKGKVAFLFPGQGTQYVNMLRDLAAKYEVVRTTFEEADQILRSELEGVKLTDILWPTPDTPEAQAASEKKLQLTEFTQPAVLAADVAILRLLRQWGIEPDVVAGHSLGEYGALVAAGVLSFGDALHAVAARGREMAHVEVPDLGKMASVSADWHQVESALKGMTEYVIPANKNCPSQTVIAGSSKGVDEAVKLLQGKGLQAQYLPVSAAFHSAIVAPASKPLRNVLSRLDVKSPKVRVLSNVGTKPYEADPEWIRDNLATQVASPVEWIGIVERMYEEGVRTFIEVGPKLALTNFVRDILKERSDAIAIGSNHPKKGGVTHVNELFAFLGAWGFQPKLPELGDASVYTASHRDPAAAFQTQVMVAAPDNNHLERRVDELGRALEEMRAMMLGGRMAPATLAPTSGPSPGAVWVQPPADAHAATPSQAPASPAAGAGSAAAELAQLRARIAAFGINLDDVGVSGISVGLPGKHKALFDEGDWDRILAGENLIEAVSKQTRQAIADKHIVRLVKGEGGAAQFQAVTDIAQVIQLAAQRGSFDLTQWGVGAELVDALDVTFQYAIAAGLEALRDAGIPLQRTYVQTSTGGYLPKEWKLPAPLRDATGVIFASAFPGYDNLVRDLSRFLADKYAGSTRDDLKALYQELIATVTDPKAKTRLTNAFETEFQRLGHALEGVGAGTQRYEFNRKFLFNVLSMGHSQLAQLIGARGPNTQVNAACASTTQALGIAEDWIRTGRCTRVLVVGADDITNPTMFPWFGAGFLAAGAATTKSDVKEAALPFDRRRHGMIVGMGAVGMLVEAVPETTRRGMRPIARVLATRVSNSAFHGSRLDVDHISQEMVGLLASARARYGVDPSAMAAKTLFMSHETYTPARGGSAAAEIHALRAAFGPAANKVVVANTKGFTGHPQGASIEDAIALKCLQRGRAPPIANLREPDPELGDLNLSKGGAYDLRYAVRLAAGFGSQVAMALFELAAREHERVADAQRYAAWLGEVSGLQGAKTEIVHRTLRIVDQGPPARAAPRTVAPLQAAAHPAPLAQPPQVAVVSPAGVGPAASAGPAVRAGGASDQEVLAKLIAIVAEKTGYPLDLLDPDQDMEADLGIDTVKQAELFGAIREAYSLPPEDGIQIKDYPTLRKVAGYVTSRLGGARGPAPAGAVATGPAALHPKASSTSQATAASRGASASAQAGVSSVSAASAGSAVGPAAGASPDVLQRLIGLVADKTGYPVDLLDPDQDMEADLGIDTVKQAELFGAIREAYSLPAEDGIQIKDYPTLRKVAGYVTSRLGGSANSASASPSAASPTIAATSPAASPAAGQAAAPARPSASVSSASASGMSPAYASPAPASPSSASASPAARPPVANVVVPDDVLQKVVALVAAKTGYPVDMLEPDQDMEADLGIDTVKQAELFGEVRTTFGIPPVDGIQLKDYPTLRKVAGFVVSHLPGAAGHVAPQPSDGNSAPGASGTPAAPAESGPASSAGNPQSLLGHVPAGHEPPVVKARELPSTADPNAKKGRTVVLEDESPFITQIVDKPTAVVQHEAREGPSTLPPFPAPSATSAANGSAGAAQAPATQQAAAPAAAMASGLIQRRVPQVRRDDSGRDANALTSGTVLVVGDSDSQYIEALAKAGFTPTYRLRDSDRIVGLVALATRKGTPALDRCLTLFDAAKRHREALAGSDKAAPGFVLVVTAQDGHHGLHLVRDPAMAAVAGVGKSLKKEFPNAVVKVLDVHPDCRTAPTLAVEELLRGGKRTEVCFDVDGKRHVVDVVPEDLPDAMPDVRGKLLMVTGGAQGIAVEMLAALAPQRPKLALLGRTDLPLDAARWAGWDEAAWKKAEAQAMAELKAKGEKATPVAVQKAVAPMKKAAEVHRNVERLKKLGADVLYCKADAGNAAELKGAVERIHSQWSHTIDGVIHAAGIEVSKDIGSKDREQFASVFNPKAAGWDALMSATHKDKVQFLVGFGSVAGRFGNLGQTDYAAANEYLAKAIKLEAQKRGAPTAFTIAWGPWGEVGMATRGSILQIMHASGVTPIPTAEGVAMFLREMAKPGVRESVVAGELGAIDADNQVVRPAGAKAPPPAAGPGSGSAHNGSANAGSANTTANGSHVASQAAQGTGAKPTVTMTSSSAAGTSASGPTGAGGVVHAAPGGSVSAQAHAQVAVPQAQKDPASYRLLEHVTSLTPGKALTAIVHVDQARDPYLRDHRVDGVPYFPGVFGIESFAQAAKLLVPPTQHLVSATDIRFASPLKQLKAAPVEGTLTATVTSQGGGATEVQCRLTTQFVGPDGRAHGEPRLHFAANLRFGGGSTGPKTTVPACTQERVTSSIYPPFFHGPSFQVLRSAGPLTNPAVAMYRHPFEPHFQAGPATFQSHPMVVEALFQACGLRTLVKEHVMSLPAGIDKLEVMHHGKLPDQVTLLAHPKGKDASGLRRFDADAVGPDGRLLVRLTGYTMVETGPAPTGKATATPVPPAATPGLPTPTATAPDAAGSNLPASSSPPATAASPGPLEPNPIPDAAVALPEVDDVVFAAVAVTEHAAAEPAWFTKAEAATLAGFKVPKRAAEWRAGRLAAKRAVQRVDPTVAATEIEVEGDPETRAPKLRVRGRETALTVSISHRDGLAVAAVSPQALGIDLETIEERAASFLEEAFSAAERQALAKAADAKVDTTCMWAAKEAALKRAGTGLKADLKAHTVAGDDKGGAKVTGPAWAFGVRFFSVDGKVLAVSLPAFD